MAIVFIYVQETIVKIEHGKYRHGRHKNDPHLISRGENYNLLDEIDGINSSLDVTEENISELENTAIESIHNEK